MTTNLSAPRPDGPSVTPNGVLIVDDKKGVRDALRELVEGLNLLAFTAKDHRIAKDTFRDHRESIGLVITDLKMDERNVPNSAGAELIDWLKHEKARCRIGVFTAFGEMADLAEKMRNPSVSFYLPKTGNSRDFETLERLVCEAVKPSLYDAHENHSLEIDDLSYGNWSPIMGTRSTPSQWRIDEPIGATLSADTRFGSAVGSLRFDLGDVRYRTVATSDGFYFDLVGNGLRVLGRPGTPALPISTQRLALPGYMYDLSVEIEDADWCDAPLSADWIRVLPVPAPRLEGEPARYVLGKDYWYSTPLLEISSSPTTLDGVPCATIALCPFQYEPNTRVFRILRSARIRVRGIQSPTLDGAEPILDPDPLSPLAHQILGWPGSRPDTGSDRPSLDGANGLGGGGQGGGDSSVGSRPSRRPRYLAVGSAENIEAIAPLLEERAKTYDLESIVIGPNTDLPANALPEERARWILFQLDRRSTGFAGKLRYVLLAGGEETIPFHYYLAYCSYNEFPKDLAAVCGVPLLSDLWYSKFERDRDNSVPNYAVGRLPFDDPARLRAYAERIVRSKDARPWRHWLFLCSRGNVYQTNVNDVIDINHVVHPLVSGCARGPAIAQPIEEPIDPGNVDRLFDKAPSLATFRGHGYRFGWKFDDGVIWPDHIRGSVSLSGLKGIISVACCTAAPDSPQPGCGQCREADGCMKHQPLGLSALDSGGALWFLGSTRPSITGSNNAFHLELMKAICTPGVNTIGDAHHIALVGLLTDASHKGNSQSLDTAAASILLGDPAAPIGNPS